jgi:hypothetical protein
MSSSNPKQTDWLLLYLLLILMIVFMAMQTREIIRLNDRVNNLEGAFGDPAQP